MSKEENRQVKNLLPLWSPYDISREDSWELVFPGFHLHILLEEEAVNRSQGLRTG